MTASPESLAPQYRDDPKVEPPYSNAQISEGAIHLEIARIYDGARRETREIYDLGRDPERLEEENWIIRWMLWHVFRYRDNRNRNRRATSPNDPSDPGGPASPGSSSGSLPKNCTLDRHAVVTRVGLLTMATDAVTGTPQSRYWDPVRES